MKLKFNCNRFCGENECNEKQNENPMLCKRVTDKLHIEQPSEEFKFWYERHFLQSPSLSKLEYDDEKMWEAWQAGQRSLGQMLKDNAELGKQPTQKPVAWMQTFQCSITGKTGHNVDIEQIGINDIPLYTHHKEWQVLSDDEITNSESDYTDRRNGFLDVYGFAKDIELILKEKNT